MKHFLKYIIIFLIIFGTPTSAKSIFDTLVGSKKECNYVDLGLYKPFSDINQTFPVFGNLMNGTCVDVKNEVSDMFITGFKVFLGLVSIIAVVNIAVAGIQFMIQEKDIPGRRGAKQRLTNSVVGLILALSGFLILNSVNVKLTDIGFDLRKGKLAELIQTGAANVVNMETLPGECIQGTTNCGTGGASGTGGGAGTAPGTGNATGAITPSSAPTIFGYRDGNGYAGNAGDNGLGNGSWSPIPGWTYYNGAAHNPAGVPSAYSQGVALPSATLIKDFGSVANVKNGAYELFVNGKSIGAFPVVDNSATKLDLTYGLVKNHIDPSVTSSNGWSAANQNITYKPLPNYWATHPRPAQPMVKDTFTQDNPSAATVDTSVTNPNTFKVQ